jgi:hypothetical protein
MAFVCFEWMRALFLGLSCCASSILLQLLEFCYEVFLTQENTGLNKQVTLFAHCRMKQHPRLSAPGCTEVCFGKTFCSKFLVAARADATSAALFKYDTCVALRQPQ